MWLEPVSRCDLLDQLVLFGVLDGWVGEIVEHLGVGEDLVDFLDVGGGRVECVVGFCHVSERRGVAGGGGRIHSCPHSAAGAACGATDGEFEVEGGECGAGEGEVEDGFWGEGVSWDVFGVK